MDDNVTFVGKSAPETDMVYPFRAFQRLSSAQSE